MYNLPIYKKEDKMIPAGMKLVPDNIYNKPLNEVPIPDGWRYKDYGVVRDGEYIIPAASVKDFFDSPYLVKNSNGYKATNVIIVVPDNIYGVPLGQVKIPEGYIYKDYRKPKDGDWYIGMYGNAIRFSGEVEPNYNRIILSYNNVYGKDLNEVKIPDGWRFSEFREPIISESYISSQEKLILDGWGHGGPVGTDKRRVIVVIDNVYGKSLDQIKIPEGWVKVGFYEPSMGENYLECSGRFIYKKTIPNELDNSKDKRRIIITSDNVYGKPLDQVLIPEGYERIDFREPRELEPFIPCGFTHCGIFPPSDKRRIIIKKNSVPRRWIVEEIEPCSDTTPLNGFGYTVKNRFGKNFWFKVVEEIK